MLEEKNAVTDKEIAIYESMSKMNSKELGTRVKEMREEAEYLKREIIQSEDDVNDVQEEFNEIQ